MREEIHLYLVRVYQICPPFFVTTVTTVISYLHDSLQSKRGLLCGNINQIRPLFCLTISNSFLFSTELCMSVNP